MHDEIGAYLRRSLCHEKFGAHFDEVMHRQAAEGAVELILNDDGGAVLAQAVVAVPRHELVAAVHHEARLLCVQAHWALLRVPVVECLLLKGPRELLPLVAACTLLGRLVGSAPARWAPLSSGSISVTASW